MTEAELLHRAKAGDEKAFNSLAHASLPKIYAVVWRIVGHPDDTEDVVQNALAKSWQSIASFDGRAKFSTWASATAARCAIDHLRAAKRWRTECQIAYANLCAKSPEMQGELMAPMMEPEFVFDLKEHISYCLICVSRSLEPEEHAALVLRDVLDLSAREACEVLGVSDSVLRHKLAGARRNMEQKYKGLCALVSKTGICHQCEGLAQAASAVGGKASALPDIATLADRVALLREVEPGQRRSTKLHDVFFRNCKRIEEKGLGAIVPEDCE